MHGYDSGYFTLPKDDQTYRVFWVDKIEAPCCMGTSAHHDITTTTNNNSFPDAPIIDGSTNGKAGTEYDYTFVATDPDGDDVKYLIDWGDHTPELTDYYGSGEEVTLSHSWIKTGTFTIKAKAIDSDDFGSNWGTLEITMPKNKPLDFNFNLLNRLFERFLNAFPILRLEASSRTIKQN